MFINSMPVIDHEKLLERCHKIRTSQLFGRPKLSKQQCADEALILYHDLLMDRVEADLDMENFKEDLIKEHQEKI